MDSLIQLRKSAKSLRRILGLSPMHGVFGELKQRSIDPRTLTCLEVFGADGQNHTKDLADVAASLEIWEIRPKCEPILRHNFPTADIKIADSYAEIKQTSRKYGLVVVDNSAVAMEHIEHFDLFPHIFRILTDPAIMVLNVIPEISSKNPERMMRRQIFYNAKDPTSITFDEIESAYATLAKQNGWTLEWIFFKRRWTLPTRNDIVYYAVLKHGSA